MPIEFRSSLTEIIARLVSKNPTLSINVATKFANEILNQMSPKILRQGKNFEYNISRQIVAEKIKNLGLCKKNLNLEKLNKNIFASCIVFDHWSSHGKNFFCAIAHTVNDKFERDQYCVALKQASADKTSNGYRQDLEQLFSNISNFEVPCVTDNCATMIKASKISPVSKKIYCMAHLLAKIDDDLHKIPSICTLDKQISNLNSYFNYRSAAYDLPLKPPTSFSDTRSWRSHSLNYIVTLRNYLK